jgi:hypothetical protein
MPRRAKSSFKPVHLIISIVAVAAVAFVGFLLLRNGAGSSGGYVGVNDLSVREFMENSNALGGNTYRIEGRIDNRLDNNWPANKGRLFSVVVEDRDEEAALPVFVPPQFKGTNIQRGQRYRFKVEVQADTGVLEVKDLSKS